jgi:hypothetical protein
MELKVVISLLIAAVEVHRPDVGDEPLLVEAAPDDLLPSCVKKGPPS